MSKGKETCRCGYWGQGIPWIYNEVICFNIYDTGIKYSSKESSKSHRDLCNNLNGDIIEYVDDYSFRMTVLRGRLVVNRNLLTLHRSRKPLTSKHTILLESLLKKYDMLDARLFVPGYKDDINLLPIYNSKLLLKVTLPFDNGEPIDIHTCDPMIKRFVREGLKYR